VIDADVINGKKEPVLMYDQNTKAVGAE
jgi:hypothetical protein